MTTKNSKAFNKISYRKPKTPLREKIMDLLADHPIFIYLSPFALIGLALGGVLYINVSFGLFPFGPERNVSATIQRLYVDVSGTKESTQSHYMVGTDKGVFEVNNSLWLWIWDADKRYSQLEVGKTYNLKVKGNEFINFLFQDYPGIISVE